MNGSKNPLAAMLETSVMCRPDNLVKDVIDLIIVRVVMMLIMTILMSERANALRVK